MIGRNGTGKSTVLRLAAGRLTPQTGSVRVAGSVGYLPQDLTLNPRHRVEHVLGIAERRTAIANIEAGAATDADFEIVGADWDIEERALAVLLA